MDTPKIIPQTLRQDKINMTRRIAIVEDEPAIRDNYREFLEGYGYQVDLFSHRIEALDHFRQQLPDLAIIDIGLEDEIEGGFELCRELRQFAPNLPIIFLTARDSELDAISGLRLGADDYLTKDISLPHLGARIIALFRRIDNIRKQEDSTANLLKERNALLKQIGNVLHDSVPKGKDEAENEEIKKVGKVPKFDFPI